MRRLTFRLAESTYRRLAQLAVEHDRSVSQELRRAIRWYLDQHDRQRSAA